MRVDPNDSPSRKTLETLVKNILKLYKALIEADLLRFTVCVPSGIEWLRRKGHVSGDEGVSPGS